MKKKYLIIDFLDNEKFIQSERQIRQLYRYWLEDSMQVCKDSDTLIEIIKDKNNVFKLDINYILEEMNKMSLGSIKIIEYKK